MQLKTSTNLAEPFATNSNYGKKKFRVICSAVDLDHSARSMPDS
ncbi:MAG: hypothetical protein ABSF63_10955 [Candidatus Bathyarchaeia archaeon]